MPSGRGLRAREETQATFLFPTGGRAASFRRVKKLLALFFLLRLAALLGGAAAFLFFSLAPQKNPVIFPASHFATHSPDSPPARLPESPESLEIPVLSGVAETAESLSEPSATETEADVPAPPEAPLPAPPEADTPPAEAPGAEPQADAAQNELLETVSAEARLVTRRLAEENASLQRENDLLRRRLRTISESLASAQAALDTREAERAPAEDTLSRRAGEAVDCWLVDVNPDLETAILSQGARSGVRYGLPLVVTRDRRKVASLRVVDVRENVSGAVVVETASGDYPRKGDRAQVMRTSPRQD